MAFVLFGGDYDSRFLPDLFQDADLSTVLIRETTRIEIGLWNGYHLVAGGVGLGRGSDEEPAYEGMIQFLVVRTPFHAADIVAIQKTIALSELLSVLADGDGQAISDFLLADDDAPDLALPDLVDSYGSPPEREFIGDDSDDNVYWGEGGNGLIKGGGGNDELFGGSGNDVVWGEAGNDTLGGGWGIDILNGGAGNDEIRGSADGDIAQFSGTWSDYSIVKSLDGEVYYLSIFGPDGFDYVPYVDWLEIGGTLRHVSTVPTRLKEQVLVEGVPWSYTLPEEIFSHGTVAWALAGDVTLPSWLTYYGGTRTFSGVPPRDGAGTFEIALDYLDPGRNLSRRLEETLKIVVKAVEDAPVLTGFAPAAVSENAANGTLVGYLSAYDPDPGDELTFRLINDAAGRFTLSGSAVHVADGVRLDYEQARSHTITVQVTDRSGASDTRAFTIAVADVAREIVKGGIGNDVIVGGAGADRLWGGLGRDILTGGKGKDVFVFDTTPNKKTNLDRITDFNVKDDSIWLDNKVFTKLGKKGTEAKPAKLNKDFFMIGSKAKDRNDYIVYDSKKGVISYDSDGSGRGKAVEIATLSKKLKMTAADFFVI